MSYSISSWEVSIENRKQIRKWTQEAMISRALHKRIIQNRDEAVILPLTAKDVGLNLWRTPPQKPQEPTLWINSPVAVNKITGIYKVIQLSKRPKVTTLSLALGYSEATTIALFDIEHIYSLLPVLDKIREYKAEHAIQSIFGSVDQMIMEAYFSEPIIYDNQDQMQIRVTSPEGNKSGDRLILGGFVLEPRE